MAVAALLVAACRPAQGDPVEPAPATTVSTPSVVAEEKSETPAAPPALAMTSDAVRPHIEFLAADAQKGRAPGTDGDVATQDYVAGAMKGVGLEPAFVDGFRQAFIVTDGVQANADATLTLGGKAVPHGLVPFSGRSGEAVSGKLVFVGHGIAPEGKGSGDYEGLDSKVKGKIVVALAGANGNDPHQSPAASRAPQKLINARDHGAVGFLLWEPDMTTPYPNHGAANDLQVPALWVGKDATPRLFKALGGRGEATPAAIETLKKGRAARGKLSMRVPIEPVVRRTANVAGLLRGSGDSSRMLVVGAHMDHLGMGSTTSLSPGEQAVHNGADDNASGVAVMLEAARGLAGLDTDSRPFDVLFIAFGAEEMGLLGSKHYVESLGEGEAEARIVAMINFDMVGRLGDDGVQVAGTGTAEVWPKVVEGARGELTVKTMEDGYGPSDHGSFYEAGVPVLHFFTGSHSDYHKPTDDIEKINFEGAARIGTMALDILGTLERERLEPQYVKVARKQSARGGFRVSLGTIPDYGGGVDGVLLSGVREGGAAAKAGLTKGDIIQKLGDREIHNLDDFMASFAVLEPDVEIDVVVQRDGKQVSLKLTPAKPRSRR